MSDAGYDIIHDLDGVLDEFDRVVGIDRLHAVHINDSKNPCGAHKDRHECIGKGYLGSEEFGGGMQVMQNIVSNGRLRSHCRLFWRLRTNLQVMQLKLDY